jgi:hypothetical protein
LCVVVAAVFAGVADAVLVAQHFPKLGAHMANALACLHELKSRTEKQPRGGEHAREKGRRLEEKRKKLRVLVFHGKQEMPVARARVIRTGE